MPPAHESPENAGRRTPASPYNFVPLPEKVFTVAEATLANHDQYYSDRHTGWLDLTIRCETPTFVRCGPPAEDVAKETPQDKTESLRHRHQFFHQGDPEAPVIPGSSLRGMTRELVEVLSFGKLQWLSDRHLVHRAVGDPSSMGVAYRNLMLGPSKSAKLQFDYPSPNVKGGYLERFQGGWAIRPARSINGETFVHVEYEAAQLGPKQSRTYGSDDLLKVFIKPPPGRQWFNPMLYMAVVSAPSDVVKAERDSQTPPGFEKAVVVRSGHMTKRDPRTRETVDAKHFHCAIYEPDDSADLIEISDDLWQLYEGDRGISRGIPSRPLKDPEDPLFYLIGEGGKLVFFGPTMMFRIPYAKSINSFVPPELRDPESTDLAEAIFGVVQEHPSRTIKGRVFFEDARWDNQGGSPFAEASEGRIVPQILSGPKPTSFQHYLVQPRVTRPVGGATAAADDPVTLNNWNHPLGAGPYDLVRTGRQGDSLAGKTEGTTIRGHKFYWHKPGTTIDEISEINPRITPQALNSTQHVIIRPVNPGTTFQGRVRFENLSDVELGALLAALRLPENQRHRLGMGKPLGMGSVKIDLQLCLTDRRRRYLTVFDDSGNVESGQLSQEDAQQGDSQAADAFRQAIIDHYNGQADRSDVLPQSAGLWEIPRLTHLAALMEWEKPPDKSLTGYKGLEDRDNRFPNWWRRRTVLPDAIAVLKGFAAEPLLPQQRTAIPSQRVQNAPPGPGQPLRNQPNPRRQGTGSVQPAPASVNPALANLATLMAQGGSSPQSASRGSTKPEEVTIVSGKDRRGRVRIKTAQGEETWCTGVNYIPPGRDKCRAAITRQGEEITGAVFRGWP